jgi:hypothetical protein
VVLRGTGQPETRGTAATAITVLVPLPREGGLAQKPKKLRAA